MIDAEDEIFDIVSAEVRDKYQGEIFISNEPIDTPSQFPCASLVEANNQVYKRTQTSSCPENHAAVLYTVEVYSNKRTHRKSECKKIVKLFDYSLSKLGLTRIFSEPTPNLADSTVYLWVARYRAVVSKDHEIYGG